MTVIPGLMCPRGTLAHGTSPDWPLTGYQGGQITPVSPAHVDGAAH